MEYRLIRSKRKTLSIEINRQAELVVRAPMRMPQARIEAFLREKAQWIAAHQQKMHLRMEQHPEPDAQAEQLLRLKAKELLPSRVAQYAQQMGLQPTGITITGARTRFGSCSPKNRLSFSFRLMDYPQEAIDYVVVHELCHFLEANHSDRFWREVARVLPDWAARERLGKN